MVAFARKLLVMAALVLAATSLAGCPLLPPPAPVATFTYEVVAEYDHDSLAFTQGLLFVDGILYESTGLFGRSSLRRVDLLTGDIEQKVNLPTNRFGEGLTLFSDRLIQLTWLSRMGFVYDRESFELIGEFQYPTEGWGITHDGSRLIMSDGTANLYFLDPETFERLGSVEVRDDAGPVDRLNELEFIEGEVFANVWQTDLIVRIDPGTGRILAWIDLSGLLPPEDRNGLEDVLNGIAYDSENGRLFVTGKLWPILYEINLIPLSQ